MGFVNDELQGEGGTVDHLAPAALVLAEPIQLRQYFSVLLKAFQIAQCRRPHERRLVAVVSSRRKEGGWSG